VCVEFFIPHYTKIHAWDKSNLNVKKLGKLLTSKRDRKGQSINQEEEFL
jgi:hypothetical protein